MIILATIQVTGNGPPTHKMCDVCLRCMEEISSAGKHMQDTRHLQVPRICLKFMCGMVRSCVRQ